MIEPPTDTQTFLGSTAVIASPQMKTMMTQVQRVAQTHASVLIEGESGAGKEIVARAVHCFSKRSERAWVDVSCAALPENLVESELFGYERGAFSGALQTKPGLFEVANGGTIFLDEVGELPPHLQVKLLRVLDGSAYYRLGGTRRVTVDVRVVAATNRDLRLLVREKLFREDLYFRLSQTCLFVPPLRERIEDIEPLANYFLEKARPGLTLTEHAVRKLQAWSWAGNIRELRNVITSAAIFCDGESVHAEDISLNGDVRRSSSPVWGEAVQPSTKLSSVERETVLTTLKSVGGHQQRAAAALGISRRTLSRRLKEYGHAAKRRA